MLTISREQVDKVKPEIQSLLALHYEELTLHKDLVKLDVDWHYYRTMEASGKLLVLTARCAEALVGYAVFVLCVSHPHYRDLSVASNDVLFLHKDFRKGFSGVRLIKESEKILAKCGYQKILWHVKQGTPTGDLLKLLGYGVEDIILGKMLEV